VCWRARRATLPPDAAFMSPIALTDDQMDAVLRAAAPLAPHDRGPFLEVLPQALQAQREIGDGTVHRAIAETQKQFFTPPQLAGFNVSPRHPGRRR
jgi:hypothetical protein